MKDPRESQLFSRARAGCMSRRRLLETGLRLGLASPVILSLIEAAPKSALAVPGQAASLPSTSKAVQEESSGTLTVLWTSGTEDIDPHYTYSELASAVALMVYEMLLILKGDSTDEFEPKLAESWEVSEDQSTYTFKLAPGATFQDGTPCDAEAVKGSFARFLLQGGGPVNVISRFVQDPEQLEVVDATTIRFNLGRPQPLFLAAMASEYGPFI